MNFPPRPNIGDTHNYDNKVWQWNGVAWNLLPPSFGSTSDVEIINDLKDVDTGSGPQMRGPFLVLY